MTTARIDFDAITERAKTARPGLALVHVIGTLVWLLGWLVALFLGYAFFGLVWMAMAVTQGFADGWRGTPTAKVMAMRAAARAGG